MKACGRGGVTALCIAVVALLQGCASRVISTTVVKYPYDRQRLRLGVGEEVMLQIRPVPKTEVIWSKIGPGKLGNPVGPTTTFTADESASRPVITATTNGVPIASIAYEVVEPFQEKGVARTRTIALRKGQVGAGMCIRVELVPEMDRARDYVSFINVEVREVPGPATKIIGYFQQVSKEELNHHPLDEWLQLSLVNATMDRPDLLLQSPHRPLSAGSFEWEIPIEWRVRDSTREPRRLNKPVTQEFELHGADGRVTIRKLGLRVTRAPNKTSGTMSWEEKCPSKKD